MSFRPRQTALEVLLPGGQSSGGSSKPLSLSRSNIAGPSLYPMIILSRFVWLLSDREQVA